jgi:transcriptional regulator with XRE-family HTH domain
MDVRIERLQKYLSLIRTSAGWSASDLGEKLGVSRQMISNLENGRNKMTMMQYRAIRNALDEEILHSKAADDTQMLEDVIRVLIDEPEIFTGEQRNQVLSDANLLAPSVVSKKTSRKKASVTWITALAGAAIAAVAISAKVLMSDKD